jgi:type IV secretory pathway VirB10-like protein
VNDRTPFVVGLLAIVAVVAWLILRGDTAQPSNPSPTPSAAPTPPKQPAPAPPSLPAPPTPTPTPSAEDTFVAQPRDDAWAKQTEAELAKRWKQIRGGTLESTECRKVECRLVVTGTQDAVAQAVADLEGPRGLHGFAENVLLSNPTVAGDTVTLRIYARFAR